MKRIFYLIVFLLFLTVTGLISADKTAAPAGKSSMHVLVLKFVNRTGDKNYAWIEGSLPGAVYESILEDLKQSDPAVTSLKFVYDRNTTLMPGSRFDAYSAAAGKTGPDIVVTGSYKLNKKSRKISIHIELYSISKKTVSRTMDIDSAVDSTLFKVTDRIAADILAHVRQLPGTVTADNEGDGGASGVTVRYGSGAACLEGDCINGYGRMRFPGGEEYAGDFSKGYIDGKGVMTWPNGDRYEGAYGSDKRNGYGICGYRNGDVYSGNYLNNIKNGTGVYKWKNGETYSGEWKNGRMDGSGTYTWPDGVIYTGQWRNGKRSGEGIITLPDSRVIRGIFSNNKLVEKID